MYIQFEDGTLLSLDTTYFMATEKTEEHCMEEMEDLESEDLDMDSLVVDMEDLEMDSLDIDMEDLKMDSLDIDMDSLGIDMEDSQTDDDWLTIEW